MNKINGSASEQASSIEQIRLGLEQVSAVIQANAATAEENSASSEEMSAQANTLRDEVGKFRLEAEQRPGREPDQNTQRYDEDDSTDPVCQKY